MTDDQAIGELERDLREMEERDFPRTKSEIDGIVARAERYIKGPKTDDLAHGAYGALNRIESAYPDSIPHSGPYSELNSLRALLPDLKREMRGVFEMENSQGLDALKTTSDAIKSCYDGFKKNQLLLQEKLDGLKRG